jgi:hypothetical protein
VSTFFARCVHTNFQLNEASFDEIQHFQNASPQEQQELQQEWCPNVFTLLGITYNIRTQTRFYTPKTMAKLESLRKVLFPNGILHPNTTPRQLAVAFGLGRWAARASNLKHTFFNMFNAAIWAAQSFQARSWDYFVLLKTLQERWPKTNFHFVFVEGVYNPADALSRGRIMQYSEEYCLALAAAAGMGASKALLNPMRAIPNLLVC